MLNIENISVQHNNYVCSPFHDTTLESSFVIHFKAASKHIESYQWGTSTVFESTFVSIVRCRKCTTNWDHDEHSNCVLFYERTT